MAYASFKITRLPKLVQLWIPPTLGGTLALAVKDYIYPMEVEAEMQIDVSKAFPSIPLDDFGYKIQPVAKGDYSEEINFTVNVFSDAGTPVCTLKSYSIPFQSYADITTLFILDSSTDVIRVDSITNLDRIDVNGKALILGKTYNRKDFTKVIYTTATLPKVDEENHAYINFSVGRTDSGTRVVTWVSSNGGSTCRIVLSYQWKASLWALESSRTQNLKGKFQQSFIAKQVKIKDRQAIPERSIAQFTIDLPDNIHSAIARTLDPDTDLYIDIELFTGLNYIHASPDNAGNIAVIITGTPILQDTEQPTLIMIAVTLNTINNRTDIIDLAKDNVLLINSNDEFNIADFNIIKTIKMSGPSFTNKESGYSVEIGTGGNIDVYIDIDIFWNVGTEPLVYSVTESTGAKTTTSTLQPHKLLFEALGEGSWIFEAKVVDANKIVSIFPFTLDIVGITLPTVVPVTTVPVRVAWDDGESVNVAFSATTTPILSYQATGLPSTITRTVNVLSGYFIRLDGLVTTAGGATVLHDTEANFMEKVNVGDYVFNETDGSEGRVLTIDSSIQLTLDGALSGGAVNTFGVADVYSISPDIKLGATNDFGAGTLEEWKVQIASTAVLGYPPKYTGITEFSEPFLSEFIYEIEWLVTAGQYDAPDNILVTNLPTGWTYDTETYKIKGYVRKGYFEIDIKLSNDYGEDTYKLKITGLV